LHSHILLAAARTRPESATNKTELSGLVHEMADPRPGKFQTSTGQQARPRRWSVKEIKYFEGVPAFGLPE